MAIKFDVFFNKNHPSREFFSFQILIYEGKCGIFTQTNECKKYFQNKNLLRNFKK